MGPTSEFGASQAGGVPRELGRLLGEGVLTEEFQAAVDGCDCAMHGRGPLSS